MPVTRPPEFRRRVDIVNIANSTLPSVSVIIPHYEMEKSLGQLLLGLNETNYPRRLIEVIVADNGSSKKPVIPTCNLDIKLISEPSPGSYAARNRALEVAVGEVIVFTDADCVPTAGWLRSGVKCLLDGADRVAGDIEPIDPGNISRGVCLFQEAFSFDVEADLKSKNHVATANQFVRREIFETLGSFDQSAFSGGDKEWSSRFIGSEFKTVFCPEAKNFHPYRSFRQLLAHRKRLGGGIRSAKANHWSVLKTEFVRSRGVAVKRIARSNDPSTIKATALAVAIILVALQLFWTLLFLFFPRLPVPRR